MCLDLDSDSDLDLGLTSPLALLFTFAVGEAIMRSHLTKIGLA